jgi:uncharacterized cupin superfamily protein
VKVFNLYGDEWEFTRDRDGWRSRFAGVGGHIGAELIGATVSEVEPGERLWPYHTHHSNEEWIIVVRGEPTLRTPEGERTLAEGDVACFVRGTEGAHQVINRTMSPVRVLMLSTVISPEIIEYLDSGKILLKDARDDDVFQGRLGPELEYWDGED